MNTARIWTSGVLIGIAASLLSSQIMNRPSIADENAQDSRDFIKSLARENLDLKTRRAQEITRQQHTEEAIKNGESSRDNLDENQQPTREEFAESNRQLLEEKNRVVLLTAELTDVKRRLSKNENDLETASATVRSLRTRLQVLEGRVPKNEQRDAAAKFFVQGVEEFYRSNHAAAAKLFSEAIILQPRDARYRYFRGLAYNRQNLWAAAKTDFQDASYFENRGEPNSQEVSVSLERIQGKDRTLLESYRPRAIEIER